jgi:hypothetical protein
MEEKTKCNKCSGKRAEMKSKIMFVFALYVLLISIYGTVEMVKNIIKLF